MEKIDTNLLKLADFGFSFKPVPANTRENEIIKFQSMLYAAIKRQARLIEWENLETDYAFSVVLRDKHPAFAIFDGIGQEDLVRETFIKADLVPPADLCHRCRLYTGDFHLAGLADDYVFAVIIDWIGF